MTGPGDVWWASLSSSLSELEPVDLSHPLRTGMPGWPTHASFGHRLLEDLPDTTARHYELTLGEHTGTHLDAASHVLQDGPHIGLHPSAGLLVPARVIRVPAGDSTRLSADDLRRWEQHNGRLAAGSAVLIGFGWDVHWDDPAYMERWPALTPDAGEFLADRALALVAVDTLSVDPPGADSLPVHRALLGVSTLIGENFANLQRLPAHCLLAVSPLRIEGGSGSPVRPTAYARRQMEGR